jgi:hypothetical protein
MLARERIGGAGRKHGTAARGCQQESNRDPSATHAAIIAPIGGHVRRVPQSPSGEQAREMPL